MSKTCKMTGYAFGSRIMAWLRHNPLTVRSRNDISAYIRKLNTAPRCNHHVFLDPHTVLSCGRV